MGCHALLQGIFLTQGSNPGPLHWQVDSLPSEPPGKLHFFMFLLNRQNCPDVMLPPELAAWSPLFLLLPRP